MASVSLVLCHRNKPALPSAVAKHWAIVVDLWSFLLQANKHSVRERNREKKSHKQVRFKMQGLHLSHTGYAEKWNVARVTTQIRNRGGGKKQLLLHRFTKTSDIFKHKLNTIIEFHFFVLACKIVQRKALCRRGGGGGGYGDKWACLVCIRSVL